MRGVMGLQTRQSRGRRSSHGLDDVRLLLAADWFDLAQRALVDSRGEEDAVEMIDLMLNRASQQPVALDPHLLAATVDALGDHALAASHLTNEAGHREAAFEADLLAFAPNHLGIRDLMDLVLDAQHDHAQWHIHLRR